MVNWSQMGLPLNRPTIGLLQLLLQVAAAIVVIKKSIRVYVYTLRTTQATIVATSL